MISKKEDELMPNGPPYDTIPSGTIDPTTIDVTEKPTKEESQDAQDEDN
jgi:hypothetical protein